MVWAALIVSAASASGFSLHAATQRTSLRRAALPGQQQRVMTLDNSRDNVPSAFATTLQTSPLLRQYSRDAAARPTAQSDAWDAHLRLYPHKLSGWARVERFVDLVVAYWDLIGQASASYAHERRRRMQAASGAAPVTVSRKRRHSSPDMRQRLDDDDDDDEGRRATARKERLRQLFGEDFRDAEDRELARVPMSRVEQLPNKVEDPALQQSGSEEDPLAGRRVRKQRSTSELEQLLDMGARFDGLFTLIDGVRKGSLGSDVVPGKLCIARKDFPTKYIVCDQVRAQNAQDPASPRSP